MKTLIIILFTFLSVSLAHAQNNYQETLTLLIKNSENDFADIMDEKKGVDGDAVYFTSKIKLNLGDEFIVQSTQTKASVYMLSADYKDAIDLEKEIKKYIKKYFSANLYKITETKDSADGLYTVEVRKGSDIEPTVILQIGKEPGDEPRYLLLSILGTEMKN